MPEGAGALAVDAAAIGPGTTGPDVARAAAAPAAAPMPVASDVPRCVQHFLEASRRSDVDLRDAVAALAGEPGLSERLIRLGRLPLYGHTWPVEDLEQAIASLGLNLAELAAVTFSVHPWAGAPCGCAAAADALRQRIGCGVAARSLALASCLEVSEEAFLCGLLADAATPLPHDAGCPARTSRGEPVAARGRVPWGPARVASRLLERWGFNEAFVESLASADGGALARIELHGLGASFHRCLSLGRDVAALALAEPFPAPLVPSVLRRGADWFGWGTRDLRTLVRRLEEGVTRAYRVLGWSEGDPEPWVGRLTRACGILWKATKF